MPFLILATLKGNVRVMQFLLEKEVESVNVCDPHHGNTPLHYAVRWLVVSDTGLWLSVWDWTGRSWGDRRAT